MQVWHKICYLNLKEGAMKNLLFLITILIYQNAQAQLVVDVADFAANPSKYNGRTIVLRGVNITKTTGATMSLSGPRTTSSQTPTSGINPSGGSITGGTAIVSAPTSTQTVTLNASATAPSATPTTATTSTVRPGNCTPPRNWEILNVEIPNYTGCFTLYSNMAKTIPNGRKANADITIFVDTNLMHRIARVKLN